MEPQQNITEPDNTERVSQGEVACPACGRPNVVDESGAIAPHNVYGLASPCECAWYAVRFEPTCSMAADADKSCGQTWLVDPAPIVTLPPPTLRPAKLHRCGKVGQHGTHLCPCGSALITHSEET